MKRRRLRPFPRLGAGRLFRFGGRRLPRGVERLARIVFKSQILTVFLGLCLLGFIVGVQSRPAPGAFPYAELFDQLQVLSYRDAPTDTSSRFVVLLCAGNNAFSQYDIDARTFQSPPNGRSYARTITGTHYGPLRVRGHVGYGFWLDVPSRRALLPEQYDELYRRTLDLVKPVSRFTGVLGIVSGYSVGYRLGTWNGSLSSHAVQQRVLATPDLGRLIAREAWRRVLLEPVVMTREEDAMRFAAVTSTDRLYANFFRLALADSDSFIPREAARLQELGHVQEARAMLAFAGAVRRAADDSVHLTNADFEAVERWATLLDRRGHWVQGAIPPPGEERIKLMGALAWYGLAPPGQNVDRVWVGPRMLVRVGDVEGFVSDEIPGTVVGCPISWRPRLREENRGASAMVSAWLADRPEFLALAVFGRRVAHRVEGVQQWIAGLSAPRTAPIETSSPVLPPADAVLVHRTPTIVSEVVERAPGDTSGIGGDVDSTAGALPHGVAVPADTAVQAADTLRARGVRDSLIERHPRSRPGGTLRRD